MKKVSFLIHFSDDILLQVLFISFCVDTGVSAIIMNV